LKSHGDIDSKFRFVIIAAKRAKLLLTGVKPKIKSKSKNPIRIAQNEVAQGLIDYEIVQPEEDFIGEEIEEKVKEGEKKEITEIKNNSKGKAGDKLKKKTKKKAKEKKK